MKSSALVLGMAAVVLFVGAPQIAFAGFTEVGTVPEPTALLVWLGLASAGGLFFWRRNREG